MKRKHSVFIDNLLALLVIILVMDSVALFAGYRLVDKTTYEHFEDDLLEAARVVGVVSGYYDLNDPSGREDCSKALTGLCYDLGLTYAYITEVDQAANSETYLALAGGKNAPEEFYRSRHVGDVVTGKVNEKMIEALSGASESSISKVNNQYGNNLICYIPYDAGRGQIIGTETSMTEVVTELRHKFILVIIASFTISSLIAVIFAYIIYMRVSVPAGLISKKMNSFVKDREEGRSKLLVKGGREFVRIADAYNEMADEIDRYINDIDDLNREKHMRQSELEIAKKIQSGLLPAGECAGHGFAVNAYIRPAREIGGDLYFYRVAEDGSVTVTVADVSGKGISAALFESRALTLLNMYADMGLSPAKSMEMFNNSLSQFNPNGLFITAFTARYDPSTKKLTYANAGHNPPYLVSDDVILLDGAHGIAAGVFPDMPYSEEEILLRGGDVLFIYTDGVNEAENADGGFFGTERMKDILRCHAGQSGESVIGDMLEAVDGFAGGAVQSDDITMLALRAVPADEPEPVKRELRLKSDKHMLPLINDAIDSLPGVPEDKNLDLKLMAEEMFVNICSYAYPGTEGDVTVLIEKSDKVTMTFIDSGARFDPTRDLLDIEEYDHEHTVGGLGRFITFNLADEYSYRYEDGKNILTIVML